MLERYLRIILDGLFPPTQHERLLRGVSPEQFVHHYRSQTHDQVITLAPYNSRTVKAAIAACKFEKNRHAAARMFMDDPLDVREIEQLSLVCRCFDIDEHKRNLPGMGQARAGRPIPSI